MYGDLYKRATQAADDILNGGYKQRRGTSSSRGLIEKPPMPASQQTSNPYAMPGDDGEDPMMEYLVAVKEQNAALKDAYAAATSGGSPNDMPPEGYANYDLGTPAEGDLGQAREALGQIESGGNYNARGPVVEKGMYAGQRAIGKYQVMPGNVPQWTEAALGVKMTPEEFAASPEAQDAVAEFQLALSKERYGTWEDAASVWFSGRPLKGNTSDDGYNTVPEYVQKFRNAMS